MDAEAASYPDCFYRNTKLAMNFEESKRALVDIIVMIGAKDKSSTFQSLAYMWMSNRNFVEGVVACCWLLVVAVFVQT